MRQDALLRFIEVRLSTLAHGDEQNHLLPASVNFFDSLVLQSRYVLQMNINGLQC